MLRWSIRRCWYFLLDNRRSHRSWGGRSVWLWGCTSGTQGAFREHDKTISRTWCLRSGGTGWDRGWPRRWNRCQTANSGGWGDHRPYSWLSGTKSRVNRLRQTGWRGWRSTSSSSWVRLRVQLLVKHRTPIRKGWGGACKDPSGLTHSSVRVLIPFVQSSTHKQSCRKLTDSSLQRIRPYVKAGYFLRVLVSRGVRRWCILGKARLVHQLVWGIVEHGKVNDSSHDDLLSDWLTCLHLWQTKAMWGSWWLRRGVEYSVSWWMDGWKEVVLAQGLAKWKSKDQDRTELRTTVL